MNDLILLQKTLKNNFTEENPSFSPSKIFFSSSNDESLSQQNCGKSWQPSIKGLECQEVQSENKDQRIYNQIVQIDYPKDFKHDNEPIQLQECESVVMSKDKASLNEISEIAVCKIEYNNSEQKESVNKTMLQSDVKIKDYLSEVEGIKGDQKSYHSDITKKPTSLQVELAEFKNNLNNISGADINFKMRYLDRLNKMQELNLWDEGEIDFNFHKLNIKNASLNDDLLPYTLVFQQMVLYGGKTIEAIKEDDIKQLSDELVEIPQCVCRHIKEQLELIKKQVNSLHNQTENGHNHQKPPSENSNLIEETKQDTNCIQQESNKNGSIIENHQQESNKNCLIFENHDTQIEPNDQNEKITNVMICQDGVKYDGQILNNYLEGKGIYFFPDGSVYEGNWSKNKMHGFGKLMVAEGHIFEGEFCSNKPHGKGIFTEHKGNKFIGNWVEGRLNGIVIFITPGKLIQTGLWCNGKFLHWSDNSSVKTGNNQFGETDEEFNPELVDINNGDRVSGGFDKFFINESPNSNFFTFDPKKNDLTPRSNSTNKLQRNKLTNCLKSSTSAAKKRNLEEWEKQAKLLPHVPHINYNRVLGRWYARVRDPNTGKRLWKGYTCSMHGFMKARQMAVERLSLHENDFIQKMSKRKQNDIKGGKQIELMNNDKYNAAYLDPDSQNIEDHFTSLAGLERDLITNDQELTDPVENLQAEIKGAHNYVKFENIEVEEKQCLGELEDDCIQKSSKMLSNGNKSQLSHACRSDYEELSKRLSLFPGVFFEPQSLSWVAFYLYKGSNSNQSAYDDIRIIGRYEVKEYGFLEARSEAIKARSHWEREANLSINLMNNNQGKCTVNDSTKLKKNQANVFDQYSLKSQLDQPYLNYQETHDFEIDPQSQGYLHKDYINKTYYTMNKNEISKPSSYRRGRRVKLEKPQYQDEDLYFESIDDMANTKSQGGYSNKDLDYEPKKTNKKKRKLPKDFVCVRHDQWGKGWRCVWADQNGFQKSKFYGESKWGREICKKKAEDLMEQIKAFHMANQEIIT